MSGQSRAVPSLRRRLVWQLATLSLLLVLALVTGVRYAAETASRASQDAVLGAAVNALADALRTSDQGLELDLPPAVFSMLGAMGEERLFYSVAINGTVISGYDGLPAPPRPPGQLVSLFWRAAWSGADLTWAATARRLLVDGRLADVVVTLGQTRHGQTAIARETALRAAWVGAGLLLAVIATGLLFTRSALEPIDRLAASIARRGPHDLHPLHQASAPRELQPFVQALNGFIARLRSSLRMTETFVVEAAHRVRTPLALVQTEAELTLAETEDPALRKRLRRMIRAIGESSRSASQILDHAAVRSRAERFSPSSLDLAALARDGLRAMAPLAELREIDLDAPDLPASCKIRGDARLIEMALRNLLDNALKYSAPEGRVTLRLKAGGRMARLSVLDEGRGLPDDPEMLTGRFVRGANSADVVGSGLGLTIVAEVAAAHGGDFALTPREEKGTCATLSLPLG